MNLRACKYLLSIRLDKANVVGVILICEYKFDPTHILQFVETAWVIFIFRRDLLEKVAEAIAEVEEQRRAGIMCDLSLVKSGFIVAVERGPTVSGSIRHLVDTNIERCCGRKP